MMTGAPMHLNIEVGSHLVRERRGRGAVAERSKAQIIKRTTKLIPKGLKFIVESFIGSV